MLRQDALPVCHMFGLWKPFPGVPKRQVVRGIPQRIIERLARMGGTSGHAEMSLGFDYDCVCTAVELSLPGL